MRKILKSIMFAFLIMAVQVVFYKIYFADAPEDFKRSALHEDFPEIPPDIADEFKEQIMRLNSKVAKERLGGVTSIKNMGKDASGATPFLIKTISDKDPYVRTTALEALQQIDDPRAVEGYLLALGDEISGNRESAVKALGSIGEKSAIEPLIETLDDEEWDVRFEASLALKAVTGVDHGVDIERWRNWYEKEY